MLDGENSKKSKEVAELQAWVALEEQREEESRRESFGLKQRIVESEASRESARKELHNLHRKILDLEHESRLREKGLLGSLEEARVKEKKLLDDARNLEIKLEKALAEGAELGLRLSAAEGRAQGLEAELARVQGLKREAEHKLGSLHSALRRTLGVGRRGRADGGAQKRLFSPAKGTSATEGPVGSSASSDGGPLSLPLSPERPPSPGRGEQLVADIDPEAVRSVLRDFLEELREAQRERDEAHSQLGALNCQLAEMESQRDLASSRAQQLQKQVAECEEGSPPPASP